MRCLPVVAVLPLLLSACAAPPGGGGPDGGGLPAAALTVSPQARTVVAGAGPIAFTAMLTGSSGPITWTLTGPGTLDPGTGAATSYTPPRTVDASTAVTVTASAGAALTASGTVTVLPSSSTIEVAGRVLGMPGNPLPGMSVAIGASKVTTDADGRFSISGVTPPYEVAVAAPGTPPVAGIYHGLTRPDPTLVFLFFVSPGEPNTGVVSGRVSGGDPIP
ncbi:MAG TPA: carboxypeptidase-like regulatory domain-containing protein, partial [Myxococcaceae bacterium]|nr:carboxypeptidase-like regulatory domain-containing protein [Myxococcaceae bacterium]